MKICCEERMYNTSPWKLPDDFSKMIFLPKIAADLAIFIYAKFAIASHWNRQT